MESVNSCNAQRVEKMGGAGKGEIIYDKSKDEKVRAHTLPMRCTDRRRVLRRRVS
jgi:hypothetical protein